MAFRYKKDGQQVQFLIDATQESGRLGWLVSHANPHCKACNCRPEVIIFDEKPRLILRAIKDIRKNKELSYDYRERRPDVIKELPWLDHSKGKEKSTESEGETNSSDSDTV